MAALRCVRSNDGLTPNKRRAARKQDVISLNILAVLHFSLLIWLARQQQQHCYVF